MGSVSESVRMKISSGVKPKEAIASSLAQARRFKKMSDGGMIEEEPPRTIGMLQEEANPPLDEVANPQSQDRAESLAHALRGMADDMSPGYAMGGLVEEKPSEGPIGLSDVAMKAIEMKKKNRKFIP